MRRLGSLKVRTRLFILVLVACLPALGLTLYSFAEQRSQETAHVRASAAQIAQIGAGNQQASIAGLHSLLDGLSNVLGLQQLSPAICSYTLTSVHNLYPDFFRLAVADPGGSVVCAGGEIPNGTAIAGAPAFQQAVQTGAFAALPARGDDPARPMLVQVAKPVFDDQGRLRAVFTAAADFRWIANFAVQAQIPSGAVLTVVDGDGTVLARSGGQGNHVGAVLPGVRAGAQPHGLRGLTVHDLDGVDRLYAFAPADLGSQRAVYVGVGYRSDAAFAGADAQLRRNLLLLLVTAAVALVATWLISERSILRPLNAVLYAARRIAAGDLASRSGVQHGATEFGRLAGAFDEMAAALQRRTDELAGREAHFRALIEHSSDIILVIDAQGTVAYASPSLQRVLALAPEALLGRPLAGWIHADDQPGVLASIAEHAAPAGAGRLGQVFRMRHGDQGWRSMEGMFSAVTQPDGSQGVIVNCRDVTERERLAGELHHRAFYDGLTGLPNRTLFADRLEHALATAARRHTLVGVLFVDLDGFKVVNDSLGHAAGDGLLSAAAERLAGTLRPGDSAARFGGDEFTVFLEDLPAVDEAVAAAERLRTAVAAPYLIEGREVHISASVGIACCAPAQAATRPEELLREADIALYQAKAAGKNRVVVFDAAMNDNAQGRLALEHDLRQAVERGELVLHFQPEVELATGQVIGAEALVRWQHPQRGLVSPAEFIPIAEETGLILDLDAWVLTEACRQAKGWPATAAGRGPIVSVNLSARRFQQADLPATVARVLAETGLQPGRLRLEITETAVMSDVDAAVATLQQLRAMGVLLAIDDFGTGYASLNYLRRFPVHTLKIDRSFITGLGEDAQALQIVRAIMHLAGVVGLDVTVEGIETALQRELTQSLHCQRAQGFLFSRPLPAGEFAGLLATWRPNGAQTHAA